MRSSGAVDATDEAVMQRVQAGDKQALGIIYDRYSRLILTIGLRILKDVSEAQELLQEVFLQLFQSSSDFDATRGRCVPGSCKSHIPAGSIGASI